MLKVGKRQKTKLKATLFDMDEHLLRFDKKSKIVFYDTETQNLCLNECSNLPWQVGYVVIQGDKILEQENMFVKWPTPLKVSEAAARITHYDENIVQKNGIPPIEVFNKIDKVFKDADYIMGHNILGFDTYVINSFRRTLGKPTAFFLDKTIDTFALAKAIRLGIIKRPEYGLADFQYKVLSKKAAKTKCSLTDLGKEHQIEHDYANLHDALCDIELNIKVWHKLKWMVEI